MGGLVLFVGRFLCAQRIDGFLQSLVIREELAAYIVFQFCMDRVAGDALREAIRIEFQAIVQACCRAGLVIDRFREIRFPFIEIVCHYFPLHSVMLVPYVYVPSKFIFPFQDQPRYT